MNGRIPSATTRRCVSATYETHDVRIDDQLIGTCLGTIRRQYLYHHAQRQSYSHTESRISRAHTRDTHCESACSATCYSSSSTYPLNIELL